jgi:hypothetical protein
MTEPSEVVDMADRILELENARNEFVDAQEAYKLRSGLSALIGRIELWRATRDAEKSGLSIIDGHVIVPTVVSRAYFNALDDNPL